MIVYIIVEKGGYGDEINTNVFSKKEDAEEYKSMNSTVLRIEKFKVLE